MAEKKKTKVTNQAGTEVEVPPERAKLLEKRASTAKSVQEANEEARKRAAARK